MRVTVGICTWNRCTLLAQGLGELARATVPSGVDWEVLVVNNNSTDATDEVIASFSARLPIRRLFEPTPGKSNALNHAIREAKGDYILWTDDDTRVAPDWISAYCVAFSRWPEAGFFGGAIEPLFAGSPPRWLQRPQVLRRVGSAFAIRDVVEPRRIDSDLPYGANFAIRRDVQVRFPYETALGPRPGSMLRGEETAVIRAMLAAGIEGWWVPDARVRHHIPEQRQTTRYLRAFFHGYGQYIALRAGDDGCPKLLGRPRWLWRAALASEIRYRLRRLLASPERWIDDLVEASTYWGQLRGHRPLGPAGPSAGITGSPS